MQITIAGYGSIGQFTHQVFQGVGEVAVYDPPKGLGRVEDLRDTDVVFVCVPTPSLPDGACDTRAVEEVVALAAPRQAIVCLSTVSIGTTERLIRQYGKPLVFVPEYAGESPTHPYRQMEHRTFFIMGGYEPAVWWVRELYQRAYGLGVQCHVTTPTVAEVVKYMENAFLALKVGFCNEFFDLCRALGVDYEAVRRLWLLDSRVHPSHTVVTPERGYGGKCLPKDVAAVCTVASEVGTPLELLETLQRVNARQRAGGAVAAGTHRNGASGAGAVHGGAR